ncbi:SSI family serine proteinase inhibitor [Actinoplanes friuliensis]|uniref:Putative subtilisin inhibitor protein n=1 Tax=Actinoplanes friuliensis DSM 7358 TaxID=1246995 RepID=U5VTX9_9ACTN|nr:SSI family serine proteinase inhibitor [Actinoplanes friuliensis]AGZ40267.1 putative subtilisin inhibitor protein [Actinoplanes friuliensis DSM 7358]
MIRIVTATAAAALLLTAGLATAGPASAAVGGSAQTGTGSPTAAMISAVAAKQADVAKKLTADQSAVDKAVKKPAKKKTELTLSYLADAGFATAVVLRCDPAGGAHPKKVKACQTLTRINGNPARLKPAEMMCTMEYAPITAEIKGTWQGRKVDWSRTFGNRCDMIRTTGVLMAF